MKFNWGTGIALFYILFAGVLLFQVYKSTTYDHSLVAKDYYAQDINYQQHYDKLANAGSLASDLAITELEDGKTVLLQFPEVEGKATGEIHFFCPSSSKDDFKVQVTTDADGKQMVSIKNKRPGLWRVKVDWKMGKREFYKEEVIII